MFTCGKGCKHTFFFALRASQAAGSRQRHRGFVHNLFTWRTASPPGLCAQFVHSGAQLHHQSFVHNLFTVACSAQPQGVLSPVG